MEFPSIESFFHHSCPHSKQYLLQSLTNLVRKVLLFTLVLKLTDQASSEELQPFGMGTFTSILKDCIIFCRKNSERKDAILLGLLQELHSQLKKRGNSLTPALLRSKMNDSSWKEFSLQQKGEKKRSLIVDAFTVHCEH